MSKGNNNDSFKFIAGIVAGAAIGFWLNSNKGRKWRSDTTEVVTDYSQQIGEQASARYGQAKESLHAAVETGNEYVSTAKDNLKTGMDQIADTAKSAMSKTEDAFQKGAAKAKAAIEKQTKKAEDIVENGKA